tara:strand:+ start:1369 stop:5520 length:4152 start_codon:yes stop_codon:yes gene_type:complete
MYLIRGQLMYTNPSEPNPSHDSVLHDGAPANRFKGILRPAGLVVASAALFATLSWGSPSHAITFKEAAKKGTATISELDELKTFVRATKLKKLARLKLSNIKAQNNVLTGDVSFMKLKWTFIASAGGTVKNTFVGFGPKKIFKFKDLFPRAKGLSLFDVMSFDEQMLLVAGADIEIDSKDMPAGAKATLGRFYENKNKFTFEMAQGVSMFGTLDMADSKPIADAMKFLGGKSTALQVKGAMSPNVLDSLLEGKPPQPQLNLEATMPTFRPKIGNVIQLPANVQFTYKASLTKDSVEVGFAGTTDFRIGKQKLNMVLGNTLKAEAGEAPSMAVDLTLQKGVPWKQAFGVKWLTIQDYAMAFVVDATGKLSIGLDGTTSFGSKAVGLGGSIQVQPATAGIPLPESVRFEINDGPNKIGALALRDLIVVFNEMNKAAKGKAQVPLNSIPDVAIAGVQKGSGPKIELRLAASGDAGIDMEGALRILGTDIARVEKAFVKADEGIEIRGNTAKLQAGPVKFPNAKVEVVARVDREAGTVPTPRVLISQEGLSLFGSKSTLDMTMFLTSSSLEAKQDFGELFKFNFKAFAGLKGLDKFEDLAKADYRILASLQSDPGKWIRDDGQKAVKQAFDGLKPGINQAVKDLSAAQKKVDGLNREITKQRNIVKKEKEPAVDRLKKAEAEVKKLQKDINYLDGRIKVYKGRIKSCNQTSSVCYKWKLTGGGCKAKKWGVCYKWHPVRSRCSASRKVPNLPARAACEAKNTKPRSELAWAETKKAGVVAAKVTAGKTVEGLRKGIQNLPIDLDPRVATLIAAREVAKGTLEGLKQTVKGFGKFTDILAAGVAAVGKPDVFALEKSAIRGSLNEGFHGKPVILDMNFRMLGKSYKNRFGFSLTDWKFNAKQFEVIALGAATKTVLKVGRDAKVVPHALLDKVSELYLKRQAEVDETLRKAIAANGRIKDDPEAAKLSMGRSIDVDNRVRRIKREAERKRKIALREKIRGIVDKKRREQIAALVARGAWKRMPGAAIDIAAGANGSVWVAGTNGSPYSWTGSTWKALPGKIVRLDVGPNGRPWAVNKANQIWRWTGKAWDRMLGGAVDVGIGGKGNGIAWVIGTAGDIWRYNGFGWVKMPGDGARIDVDPNGNAWIVNKARQIYRWDGKKWLRVKGAATDIAIGANGTVMVIGTDKKPWAWNGKAFTKLAGADLTNITVDRAGLPWGTTADNGIWAWGKAANAPVAVAKGWGIDRLSGKFALKVRTSGRCFDMTGKKQKGVRQHQWDCNPGNKNQQFFAEYVGGEWFRIRSVISNRCVDVSGVSKNRGAAIHQWDCHNGANQKWRIVKRGGGWNSLVAQHSNKCLDLAEGKKNNGAQFHQWDCNAKNSNQLFQVIGVR